MKRHYIVLVLLSFLAGPFYAQRDVGRQLEALYLAAMKCYQIDDYQQLDTYIRRYDDVYYRYMDELGDSVDVFGAYQQAMQGAYDYGLSDNLQNALYASSAVDNYNSSLEVFRRRNSMDNVATLHEELSQLYYKVRMYDKATLQQDSAFSYYDDLYNGFGIEDMAPLYYRSMSQLAMCNARIGEHEQAISQIDTAINEFYSKKKGTDYYEALRKKGKILMLKADQLGTTDYKQAVECYRKYVSERCAEIGAELDALDETARDQHWLSMHQFLYDCYRLGNYAPEMLYDLALFSKDFLVRRNARQTTWKQVRRSMGKQECAVEFVQYFGKDDKKRMGCLVLRDKGTPHFIDLFSVDSLLNLPLDGFTNIGNAIMASGTGVKNSLYSDERLSGLIWNPQLMQAVGEASSIYFAPDGLLHQLAIEYIIPDTTKTCYRLSSTRNLVQRKRTSPKMERLLMCGGVEYDTYYSPKSRNNDAVAYRSMIPYVSGIFYLPNTLAEVDSIHALRNNPKDRLLKGTGATDEKFLEMLAEGYDAMHIATHGIFDGIIDIFSDVKPLQTDESMSKSALLLAGCIETLSDPTFDDDLFDGVLSAKEIARQDLSNVKLVVLAACQTGLGRLTDDGVYGMQRALKQAGAQAMILSLWPVDDYAGSMLMRFFYEELQKQATKDLHTAFIHARKRLMQEERYVFNFDPATLSLRISRVRYKLPQYTCPFILVDAL